jgi:hypothetical protein
VAELVDENDDRQGDQKAEQGEGNAKELLQHRLSVL